MNNEWVKEMWSKLDEKLSRTAVLAYDKLPYTTKDGIYDDWTKKDKNWWTNGFWPAMMVLMYSGTKKEQYLKTGRHAMDLMDETLMDFNGGSHDMGFMWNISAGMDYRLTGDKVGRNRYLIAANHLMGRYNSDGEYIVAWNNWNGDDHRGWAIIDCMMNLPLLYRASEEVKDDRFTMVAKKHANKTMKYHVRPDGSCNHINEYNPATGEFVKDHGGQGYCDGSSWSRGQAWGIYGFVLSYKHTKNPEYLDTAKRIAHYFIANTQCTDWLPRCDFKQPAEPVIYDSTAGACAACGLLEIADSVPENEKDVYYNAAVNMLKAINDKCCDWTDKEESIVQLGTEAYHNGIHMPIIYGDYFFAEGIYRLMGFNKDILW